MDMNNYDINASRTARQKQLYEGGIAASQDGRQPLQRPGNPWVPQSSAGQKPKAALKMPKARVLALAHTFKRWLAIASIVSFGTFGGLVAVHQVGTTTQSSSVSSQSKSTTTTSSKNSNNFLQQGGNTNGTSTSSTKSSSGTSSASKTSTSGTSTASSTPVSGTHTS